MFKQLKSLLFTDTTKDTSIVFAATILNAIVGGLFFIFAPRILGPADYGLFAVVTSTGILISNIAHFGIDTGILRFVNHLDQEKSNRILKLAFYLYLCIGGISLVSGFALSPVIAALLGDINLMPLFRVAFGSVFLLLLTDFFIVYLQTKKQFAKASFVNISANLTRIAILAIGGYMFHLNLYLVTVIFFLVPIVSVIVGKLFTPSDFLKAEDHTKDLKEFFTFNFWIFATLVISTIPFDNYFLVKMAGPAATGLYAAPYKLISITDQFAGNFSRVFAPRFTSFKNIAEAKSYALKTAPIILAGFLAIASGAIFASPIVNIVLGGQYSQSVTTFSILALGFAFYFTNTTAVSVLIYFFGESKNTFLITFITKIVFALSSFFLISKFQQNGAALAFLISGISSFLLFNLFVILKLRHEN